MYNGFATVWTVTYGLGVPLVIAQISAPKSLTTAQVICLAGFVSLLGGVAAALRRSRKFSAYLVLQVSANTLVMGVSLSAVGNYFSHYDPALGYAIVGGCGILSLGGLASIDWVVEQAQRRVGKANQCEGKE